MANNQDDITVAKGLKEDESEKLKRGKHSGEVMKERNMKRKLQEKQQVTGTVRIYTDTNEEKITLFNKLDKAKLCVGDKITNVSNYSILNTVLNCFLESNGINSDQQQMPEPSQQSRMFKQYLYCDKNTSEDLFVCSESGVKNIMYGIQEHFQSCKRSMDISEIQTFGHVKKFVLTCVDGHTLRLDSSPHMEGGKFLINMRLMHGMYSSGLRYSQYERFCNSAGTGVCSETTFSDIFDIFCVATKVCAEMSMQDALHNEIGQTLADFDYPEYFEGIDIISDARHATRKIVLFQTSLHLVEECTK